MARRERAKFNIPMVVACVLLCLTMFSTHFASDIFARYTTRADGKDLARVAGFGEIIIEETGDFADGSAHLIPGVSLEKRATVTFGPTELASCVFVKVEFTTDWYYNETEKSFSMLDEKVSWKIAEGWNYLGANEKESIHVFYRELAPNEQLDSDNTVDIIAGEGAITVSRDITKAEMSTLTGAFSIKLSAVAVQMSGFDSVADAWASASK
ncbi:MAG: hypothetical protein IJA70_11275 [Oscillospiraceae bacterium]|nr:hypothetical protein [Oscillospiraceae bacterium]